MNQTAAGGTFRSMLGAARSFGLVETQHGGFVSMTRLGRNVLDDAERSNALAEAFLNVPLHAKMYEQYQGNALPPPAAVERHMEGLGVPPKQKERARQTFTSQPALPGSLIRQPSGSYDPLQHPICPPRQRQNCQRAAVTVTVEDSISTRSWWRCWKRYRPLETNGRRVSESDGLEPSR